LRYFWNEYGTLLQFFHSISVHVQACGRGMAKHMAHNVTTAEHYHYCLSHVHLLMLPSYNIKERFTYPDDNIQASRLVALVMVVFCSCYIVGHMLGHSSSTSLDMD
jgi:hypothetical protein